MAETSFPLNTGAKIPALGFGEYLPAFEIDNILTQFQVRGKQNQEK
jgi:hypothetical protein